MEKILWWACADDIINQYIRYNLPLRKLAEQHECYFMCSGTSYKLLHKLYPDAHVIECANNYLLKGKLLFDTLKQRDDYQYLVRLDFDALIMDLPRLVSDIEATVQNRHAIAGNPAIGKAETHIRGACMVMSRSVVDAIDLPVDMKSKSFDEGFSVAAEKAHAEIIRHPFFELNEKWTGKYPVWHPTRYVSRKYDLFLKQVKALENGTPVTPVASVTPVTPKVDPIPATTGRQITPRLAGSGIIPKEVFFFWGNTTLSWMRYLTLKSFRDLNPSWGITLYQHTPNQTSKTWETPETQDFHSGDYKDYSDHLSDLDISIQEWEPPAEVPKDIGPQHISNFLKWHILATQGGIYADMDILWIRSFDSFWEDIQKSTAVICYKDWFSIGVLASQPNSDLFREIYESALQTYDLAKYQSAGVKSLLALLKGNQTFDGLRRTFPLEKIFNIPMDYFYFWTYRALDKLFSENYKFSDFPEATLGVHWYAGHSTAQRWNGFLTADNYKKQRNTFCNLVSI